MANIDEVPYIMDPLIAAYKYELPRQNGGAWDYIHSTLAQKIVQLNLNVQTRDIGTIELKLRSIFPDTTYSYYAPQANIQFYLNPSRAGQVSVSKNGIAVVNPFDISFSGQFPVGEGITVRASANLGYKFQKWVTVSQKYGTLEFFDNPKTLSVEQDYTLTAVFVADTPPPPINPPGGIQRKCIDSGTIGVWNQVLGKYDIAPCSAGRHCENGYCVEDTPPPTTQCQEGATRTVKCPKNGKDVSQVCTGGAWINKDDKACEDNTGTILIALIVIVVLLILIFGGKKK